MKRRAPNRSAAAAKPGIKRINVALQGGGAHGAYAWGVLDRLLEDERIEIEAISGTSAGAMNAVVLAEGLAEGGRRRAREQLCDFWRAISIAALASPIQRSPLDILLSNWSLDYNPMLILLDMMAHVVSPYQFNPFDLNPVRDLLLREVNFQTVQGCHKKIQLFISATNVYTGQVRVFTGGEVTADAVMASACLPYLFKAVMIEGVPYWDGGYVGNPMLSPFFEACVSRDVLLVQVNPVRRRQTPTTARDILNRINEISFNAPLIRELKHVQLVNQALQRGDLSNSGYREIYLHLIGGGDDLEHFSASSKLNAEWLFLTSLRDLGRAAAADWLRDNYDHIGIRSTMDVAPMREGKGQRHRTAKRLLRQTHEPAD